MDLDQLLQILACPKCHGDLTPLERGAQSGLLCPCCQVVYPIRDQIPVMLIEEAVPANIWPDKE